MRYFCLENVEADIWGLIQVMYRIESLRIRFSHTDDFAEIVCTVMILMKVTMTIGNGLAGTSLDFDTDLSP